MPWRHHMHNRFNYKEFGTEIHRCFPFCDYSEENVASKPTLLSPQWFSYHMLFFYQMGCQASRLEQDEEGEPARPGLLRRFEDIEWLRRSESIGKSTLSTELLIEEAGGEDEEGSTPKHSDKDISHISVESIGLVKAPSLDEVNVKIVGPRDEKEEKDEERDKGKVDDGDGSDDQDNDRGFSDREDHLFGPRSPSFREKCINCDSRELDKDDGHVKGEKREKKSQRTEGTAPPNQDEGSITKLPKKELKRRSFRKVLKKDESIKSLRNVISCYNPTFSSSDQDRPLQEGEKAS